MWVLREKKKASCPGNMGSTCLDFPSLEYIEIPYEGGKTLPAIFVKGSDDQKAPRPAVVFFDGLDVTKEMCSFFGVPGVIIHAQ